MLHQQIKEEIKEALKSKEELKLTVLRGLLSACTNELVANKRKPDEDLGDEDVLIVINRAAKQRKDSIEQFEKGNRNNLAEKEKEELKILEAYLPKMMDEDEIEKIVVSKKKELEISDKSEMGKLMSAVMQELKGKADGKDVKDAVDQSFS